MLAKATGGAGGGLCEIGVAAGWAKSAARRGFLADGAKGAERRRPARRGQARHLDQVAIGGEDGPGGVEGGAQGRDARGVSA